MCEAALSSQPRKQWLDGPTQRNGHHIRARMLQLLPSTCKRYALRATLGRPSHSGRPFRFSFGSLCRAFFCYPCPLRVYGRQPDEPAPPVCAGWHFWPAQL